MTNSLPAKFRKLDLIKQSHQLNQLRNAAQIAIDKGWHVFPCPYQTKLPFKGTHGFKDARSDSRAIAKWDAGYPANPCIALEASGLTVLDIDGGLGDYNNALAWARHNGLPETYVVQSGRVGGGYHSYFRGTRDLPDVCANAHAGRRGFELDDAHGDIKSHGYVVAEGGLHKSGATYKGNGLPIAPLPDWLRDWEEPAAKAKRAKQQEHLGKLKSTQTANLVLWKHRNNFLWKEAGRLHYLGLNEETVYQSLRDIARRYVVDGDDYVLREDAKLRDMARRIHAMPFDRIVNDKYRIMPRGGGVIVRVPVRMPKEPTAKERLASWLTQKCPLGEIMSVRSILEHFERDHPDEPRPPKVTLHRAMESANFRQVGVEPADNRVALWSRYGDLPQLTTVDYKCEPHSSYSQ